MLSFLFLQSEFSTEWYSGERKFFKLEMSDLKNILKKVQKYFVSSKKLYTFALANENGIVLSL